MRKYEVIIPVRNGGQALIHSIQSVLSCANADRLFLTLSDNFSTDGSPWKQELEKFPSDAWRVISPPQPLGRVEHWSWAFAQAQLPWVKLLMAGDRIENAYWNWADAAIARYPQAGVLFSGSSLIDPTRAHPDSGPVSPVGQIDATLYTYEDFMRDGVRCLNRIGALTTILVRDEILRKALPFQPEFPWTADWRFYKRLMQQTPAAQTSARLVRLDRSIARLSTSWKGMRSSFREDWIFAAEQAAEMKQSSIKSFSTRCQVIGTRMFFVLGKRLLPKSVRGFLTTATGLHRNTF
jgi:hypothetical protein